MSIPHTEAWSWHIATNEIYAETQQREKYKDELWRIILEYDIGDFDTYKELKIYYAARCYSRPIESTLGKE